MDKSALYKLSYGLFVITTRQDGRDVGCVANTLIQVTSDPPRVSVALNKENYTTKMIEASGIFAATVLAESADMNLIAAFGFQSSETADKFAPFSAARDAQGIAYIPAGGVAELSCKVIGQLDAGSHKIFLADVVDAKLLSQDPPMTYAYYREVKKGTTPPKASSYQAPEEAGDGETPAAAYQCEVCGYIERENLPLSDDYRCPICGAPVARFRPVRG